MSVFVHIGYPKSASTALQDNFFSQHPNLHYLGKVRDAHFVTPDLTDAILGDLRLASEIVYDASKVRAALAPHLAEAQDLGKPAVISDESIIENDTVDLSLKLRRLKDVFGSDLVIVVIIREQFSLIRSMYKEDLKKGNPSGFREYLDALLLKNRNSLLTKLRYDKVLECVAEIGLTVRVFVFEDLQADRSGFLRSLERAFGVSETTCDLVASNVAPDDASLERLLAENRAHPSLLGASRDRNFYGWGRVLGTDELLAELPETAAGVRSLMHRNRERLERARNLAGPRVDPVMEWPEDVTAVLRPVFGQSNRAVARDHGLDLQGRGYCVD